MVAGFVGNRLDIRRDQVGKALRRGSQLTGGGTQIFIGRAGDQLGLLLREGRAVPVHEPLAVAGALHVKVGQQRHYFGSSGHGAFLRWLGLRSEYGCWPSTARRAAAERSAICTPAVPLSRRGNGRSRREKGGDPDRSALRDPIRSQARR